MAASENLLGLYLHLARAAELRRRPWVRDKLLVLAATSADQMGLEQIAAFCRRKILANNPGHLVGHYPTVAAALDDERFRGYLTQLRRSYTQERAEHMLASLGIDLARERDAYFSDHEYAAALLGTSPEELESLFGASDEPPDPPPDANPYRAPKPPGALAEAAGRRAAPVSLVRLVIFLLLVIFSPVVLIAIALWILAGLVIG